MILDQQFQHFQKQVQDILTKEDQYESNLEMQEKNRLSHEKKHMREHAQKEEKRARNLLHDMQVLRTNQADYEIKQKAMKRKMQHMMEDLQKQIGMKRSRLVEKLERMRRLHMIEQKIAAKKLIELKQQVGTDIANMDKRGSPEKCFTTKSIVDMNKYCNLMYRDVDLQNECKNPRQFCYMCCDMEVGMQNKDMNSCCYSHCDLVKKNNNICDNFNEIYHVSDTVILH